MGGSCSSSVCSSTVTALPFFLLLLDVLKFERRHFCQFDVAPCLPLGERIVWPFLLRVFEDSRVNCWLLENVLESRQMMFRVLEDSLEGLLTSYMNPLTVSSIVRGFLSSKASSLVLSYSLLIGLTPTFWKSHSDAWVGGDEVAVFVPVYGEVNRSTSKSGSGDSEIAELIVEHNNEMYVVWV